MEIEDTASWMLYGGLGFGLIFGFVLQRSRFCLLAAVSNYALFRDSRHMHAWIVAVAVAIAGASILEFLGLVALEKSSFRNMPVTWAGSILGGLVFGLGTAIAGGCASRTVIRASEGNFGALITLVCFAAASMATLFGLFSPFRGYMLSISELDYFGGEQSAAGLIGMSPLILAAIVSIALLAVVAFTGRSNRDWGLLSAGALIGALMVAVWWYSGYLVQDEFDPRAPFSLSVSGPLARTGLWLTTGTISATWFGITLIVGMLVGGLVSSVTSRSYHWVVPEATHVPHLIGGGLMMGIGAVFAGGCNVGQGLAGLSTLSISSILTVVAILAGIRLGVASIQYAETHKTQTSFRHVSSH